MHGPLNVKFINPKLYLRNYRLMNAFNPYPANVENMVSS
jgi:hypothetical protein